MDEVSDLWKKVNGNYHMKQMFFLFFQYRFETTEKKASDKF